MVGDAAVGVGCGEVGIESEGRVVVGQRLGIPAQIRVGEATVVVVDYPEDSGLRYTSRGAPLARTHRAPSSELQQLPPPTGSGSRLLLGQAPRKHRGQHLG